MMRDKHGSAKEQLSASPAVVIPSLADIATMGASSAKRGPPAEKPEAARMRSLVISAFWAVLVFLGLPMWWKTTSIYRARLPLHDMIEWADGKVVFLPPFLLRGTFLEAEDIWN
jgi:phosphatidylinositol glycan class S